MQPPTYRDLGRSALASGDGSRPHRRASCARHEAANDANGRRLRAALRETATLVGKAERLCLDAARGAR